MVKESDKQYLKQLTEKYGKDCIYNTLLEYTYGGHTFDSTMHSAGQKDKYSGINGLPVIIPSFLLCALISPPAALILLIGAVANRITARWYEQKNTILGALNPFSWAEYLATGNYRSGKGEGGKDNKSDNSKGKTLSSKDFSDVSTGEVMQDAITGMYGDKTIDEFKKLVFRYWFITFDNGEVLKALVNDKEAAKYFGNVMIKYPLMLNRFGRQLSSYEQYKSMMDQEYKVYKAIYDDGQVLYTIGKDEQEASATAREMVKGYAKGFDNSYKNNNIAKIDKFKVPNLIRLDEQETLEIKFPEKIENISEYATVPAKRSPHSKKEGYFWQWGEKEQSSQKGHNAILKDVETKLSKGLLVMHIPAENRNSAENIITKIFRDEFKNSPYGKQFMSETYEGENWYRVSFLDGDKYIIHDRNKDEAKKKVLHFYKRKVDVAAKLTDEIYRKEIYKKRDEVLTSFSDSNITLVKEDDLKPKVIDMKKINVISAIRDYDEVKERETKSEYIKGSVSGGVPFIDAFLR